MGSVNKWIGIGNLGRDPETKTIPSGQTVTNFSLACNEVWKDKNGEKQERVEWVRVIAWGTLGENCGKYLAKGRQAYVEGKLQTRKWQDKDGNDRWTTEVVARNVVFLGGGKGQQDSGSSGSNNSTDDYGPPPVEDENIPF
jgi:single-strand DNA-binding protein